MGEKTRTYKPVTIERIKTKERYKKLYHNALAKLETFNMSSP